MKTKLFLCMLVVSIFSGCSVNPSGLSDKYAKDFVSKIKYVKDKRTDVCFAMVASRKTADTDQTGIGISEVPCEKVKHLLVE